MNRKAREGLADNNGASRSPRFPLPRKAAKAITGVPAGVRGADLPSELLRVLKRVLQHTGPEVASDLAEALSPLQGRVTANPQSLADQFDQFHAVMDTVTAENPTFSSTVPIVLQRHDNRPPEPIASGVLIRIIDRTFLLTAAHVTDRKDEGDLMMPGRKGFMQVTGWFSSMRIPGSDKRADDKLDVAYYRLDDDCLNDLHTDCQILGRQDVCLEGEPRLHTMYTFAGYPWRRCKVKKGSIATDFTTATSAEAKTSVYEQLGLSRSRHIIISFNRKRTYSQRLGRMVTSCSPEGMSGGGVYVWSKEALARWPVRLPLAGIATEFIPDRSLLIATRLHVFINCIFHNQPDLAAIARG